MTWLAFGRMPLLAVIVKVNVYGPAPRFGGVPVMAPVVLLIDSQAGAPVRLNVGTGLPVAVTGRLPAVLTVPKTVSMRKVDLAIELQILSFYQLRRGAGPSPRPAERAG